MKLPRRTKGSFLWKKYWYSLCSMHIEYKEDCNMCNAGTWYSIWRIWFNEVLWKISPELWRKMVNRKKTLK